MSGWSPRKHRTGRCSVCAVLGETIAACRLVGWPRRNAAAPFPQVTAEAERARVTLAAARRLAGLVARALGGVAAAPVPAQQPEAKVGLAGDFWLIRAARRLQDPPADEVAAVESGPKAEPGHLARGGDPALMGPFDLGTRQGAPGEVAHDFGIGVQLDLELEVFAGQRHEISRAVRNTGWVVRRSSPEATADPALTHRPVASLDSRGQTAGWPAPGATRPGRATVSAAHPASRITCTIAAA
jgi:hypothetical protein